MSDTKLKPCPFCGGEAETIENNHYTDVWSVMCKNCFAESDRYHTEESAIEAWNTRKPMERIVEQLEEQQNKNRYENHHDDWNVGLDQAIEIVRKEGAE